MKLVYEMYTKIWKDYLKNDNSNLWYEYENIVDKHWSCPWGYVHYKVEVVQR